MNRSSLDTFKLKFYAKAEYPIGWPFLNVIGVTYFLTNYLGPFLDTITVIVLFVIIPYSSKYKTTLIDSYRVSPSPHL